MNWIVGTDSRNESVRAIDRAEAHRDGLIHRSVHLEIWDATHRLLVWRRRDGRLEIPGGHVDWLVGEDRAESFEEAALRELDEELNLKTNWSLDARRVVERLRGRLSPLALITNQLPSRGGLNNEWVAVHRLYWDTTWGDPTASSWVPDTDERTSDAAWMSLAEVEHLCSRDPRQPSSSLRLLLSRHGVLIPFVPAQP